MLNITRLFTAQYNVSIKYNTNDRYETCMNKVSALDTISGYKKQRYWQKWLNINEIVRKLKLKLWFVLMEFPVSNCPPNGSGSSLSMASVPVGRRPFISIILLHITC